MAATSAWTSSPESALSLAGRFSVSRTPHGVRARSRTGTSAAIVRSLQDDQGINGERAAGRRDDRVQIDLEDVRPLDPEPTEREEHRHERLPIDRRPAADAEQQARSAQLVEHGFGRCRVERGQPDGHVVEDLGQDPAEPDEHGRPELRIAAQAEDELDARRRHRLDQQPADGEPAAPARLEQRQGGAVDGIVAAQSERDPADVGLVDQPDGIELERHRPRRSGVRRPRRSGRRGPGSPRSRRCRRVATKARLSRSDSGNEAAAAAAVPRPGPRRTSVRSAASAGQPGRHGPSSAPPRGALPARDLGDGPERLDRAAQERRSAAGRVEQRLRLGRRLAGRQRHVGRQDRRPVRGRGQQRRRSPRWRGDLGRQRAVREVVDEDQHVVGTRAAIASNAAP